MRYPCDRCQRPLNSAGWTYYEGGPVRSGEVWCSVCAGVHPVTGDDFPVHIAKARQGIAQAWPLRHSPDPVVRLYARELIDTCRAVLGGRKN